MKKIIASLIISLFLSSVAYSQQIYTLSGNVKQMAGNKVELLNFYGNKNSVIDSCFADDKGKFRFQLKNDLPTGIYRVKFAPDKFVDIIYNHENIDFTFSVPDSNSGYYSLANNIVIALSAM